MSYDNVDHINVYKEIKFTSPKKNVFIDPGVQSVQYLLFIIHIDKLTSKGALKYYVSASFFLGGGGGGLSQNADMLTL